MDCHAFEWAARYILQEAVQHSHAKSCRKTGGKDMQ